MSRPASDIAKVIDKFEPKNGNWIELDDLLQELFRSECPTLGIDALLRVFERFPTEDGAEVFWGVVHGLESLPGYEEHLVQSVSASPSEFGLIMVNRLLNSGVSEVADIRLLTLLEVIAQKDLIPDGVRRMAEKFRVKHTM